VELVSIAATNRYDTTYSMSIVRDPFDLRRSPASNIIRGTTANITQRVKEAGTKAYDTSRQAIEDMSSFSPAQNISSYATPQREMENRAWASSGVTSRSNNGPPNAGVMSGIQDRMGGLFEKNKDLPMYKDKPYSYASSRRRRPVWQRKRVIGIAVAFFVYALYLFGFFSSSAPAKASKDKWSFFKGKEDIGADWLGRRERVKEAFTLSWDAYEKHGWGRSIPRDDTMYRFKC
jgi:hypothetical protein